MTHKFAVTKINEQDNVELPVLYYVHFNSGFYYLHKGKNLHESSNKLLYDVFRATMKPVVVSEDYVNMVAYCKRFPQVNMVTIEVVFNGEPQALLKKEKQLWNKGKKDAMCLNRLDKLPYTPEWMIREKYVTRCEECLKSGTVKGKVLKFVFCPMCGKSIRK